MAAAVDAVRVSAGTNINCSQENAKILCSCCAKVNKDLQRIKTELKALEEIVKIMKEDQHRQSVRLDYIVCLTEKKKK
jgi:predicted transcriptional regulator